MSQGAVSLFDAPIGVFDSGLGGLTVARCLREALPDESILYVADQAHVPYGGRDLSEVCGFACGISEALVGRGCKAIVMACNISSATALTAVREAHRAIPILGVIAPGARIAAQKTCNGRIGVLATLGTVKSGAYTRSLHALDPDLTVCEVGCPDFVPLVEDGKTESPEAFAAANRYLDTLRESKVDTVILGCTHYPFLLSTLRQAGPEFQYIDPAWQTVADLKGQLIEAGLLAPARALPVDTL